MEAIDCWKRQPNKLFFIFLIIPWIILFQFWGNITLGYYKTSSLFEWMYLVYTTSPDDEHGLLIPFVVLGLFWWKRKELMEATRDTWFPSALLIMLGIALHLVGYRVQQTRLSIMGFFVGAYGIIGLTWGKEFLKRSFFPMFLFVFCIPLASEADRITSPLRLFATAITSGVANDLLGLGVVREGTAIFDPAGQYQYEVAAACSGIRSLTAIFAFTTVYSFITFQRNWKRAAMILAAFPLAIISNVMRLLMIILAAELFGQDAGNYVHENSVLSLLPYIPGIGGVLLLGWLLRDRPSQNPPPTSPEPLLA